MKLISRNFNITFKTTDEQKVVENHEELKAIVVADRHNNHNYQYLLDEKKWVKINDFPKSVGEICGIHEVNNVFYVVGKKGISTLNNEFYKFLSSKNYDWCTSCRVGNNILLIRTKYNADLKLFNTVDKQWSDVNIETNRLYFDAVHYLNKVWIVGGQERDNKGNFYKLNTIQIYDPVNKATSLSPIEMIQARCGHEVIVYNNKLFVFGGSGDFYQLNSVEMYSPDTNKFITMAPMKISRSYFACCRVGNLVYCIGGFSSDGFKHDNSVEIYNLDLNTWTDGENIPVSLSGRRNSLTGRSSCVVSN